ncbi:PREDICTED: uncharacterized protein LOC108752726 [Trachymyrmex septentrionalis]|uniref:uncharacterized protein LOC108752726 n=1 Tax=Trachymyrmex septentrionalis TaxID=34720 RepID=UPI00084F38E6|nr:PREDICTED: uncharacterized protein LOC108752726 [Trachymyrmex septentrionalis]
MMPQLWQLCAPLRCAVVRPVSLRTDGKKQRNQVSLKKKKKFGKRFEMSELYGESVNNTKIEEHLEKSMISQDDYKKMKQENEDYRQELYVLRLKLETSDAIVRDLQDSGETLENNFKEYVRQATVLSSEKKEK